MTRTLALLFPLLAFAPLGGCIIYENNGDQLSPDGWDFDGDDCDACTPDQDTAGDEQISGLSITPDQAEAGQTLIITMTADVEFDFDGVIDVFIPGPAQVLDWACEDDHLVLVVSVADNAPEGAIDVNIVLADGTVLASDVPLTVVPAAAADDGGCN